MKLASLQEEISILKQESANMIEKISTKTVEIDKIKALESEKTFYKTQMTTLVGNNSLLLEITRSLMRFFSETHYAEKQYLLSLKEHEVIFRCKTFVDKMALEMEKKIHEYHVERIKQINQCVNNIWKHTYESKDIQEVYIELADDNKKLSHKKNFTYRLMGKFYDNKPSELKGRCSAGQKMMISIVIRLALAEAFCSRCRVISLDEPTTNLDKLNSGKLASFLKSFLERDQTKVDISRIAFI